MPDPPRKIDLSLPANYFAGPMTRVSDWLNQNTNSLRALNEAQIVQRVRTALAADITRLNDGDIAALVEAWADDHGFRLVRPPGPPPGVKESEITARLKRIFGAIPTKLEYDWTGGKAAITVSGATAALTSGKTEVSVTGTWGGELQFKTQAQGAAFAASMSSEAWKLSFTIGKLAPDLSSLETVFKKGQSALVGALGEIPNIDWKDPAKTKEKFAPYLDPIKAAVDAASKVAGMKPGDISFGVWVEGGMPGGPAKGVSGGLRLTIVF